MELMTDTVLLCLGQRLKNRTVSLVCVGRNNSHCRLRLNIIMAVMYHALSTINPCYKTSGPPVFTELARISFPLTSSDLQRIAGALISSLNIFYCENDQKWDQFKFPSFLLMYH